MTAKPLVSVVMPTYNQGRFIERALKGLAEQTFRDFELIVVIDGSTDDTLERLEAAGCPLDCLVELKDNQGTANAINRGCEEARGLAWTWVSSDNVMRPTWLASLTAQLAKGEAGAVYSAYRRIQNGRNKGPRRKPYSRKRLLSAEGCYFGPSFLIDKEVWLKAGAHRGQTAHDYDHWSRVEEACWERGLEVQYVPEVLCDYYVGPWCTVRKNRDKYDAAKWREEAKLRRGWA